MFCLKDSCKNYCLVGFTFIFTFLAIAGCSTNPRIHLYAAGEPTNQKDELISRLRDYNFKVDEFYATVPELEAGNYIVYYPSKTSEQTTEIINLALRDVGLPEGQPIPFRIGSGFGSHEYTKGNVGLYLVNKSNTPSDVDVNDINESSSQESIDFTEEQFGSKGCNESFLIEFYGNGRAFFIHEDSQKKYSEGRWDLVGNYLTIKKLFGSSKFQVEKHMISLNGSELPVIDLIPVGNKNAPFNCIYSTYFKEGIYKLPSL